MASAASAWEQLENLPAAVRVLEQSSAARTLTWGKRGSVGMWWLRNQWRLAQLYRKLNRVDDAREIESELLALLAYADADHPMLLDLQQRSGASAN